MPSERDPFRRSQPSDDETLWTFYNLLRHRPKVIIVLRSLKEWTQGGPGYREREKETACAMAVAGVEWEQWPFLDVDPDWPDIADEIRTAVQDYDMVIGPAWELGGHEHHNEVASLLKKLLGEAHEGGPRYIAYTSYVRGSGRTDTGTEVVPTADERMLKDVALSCYKSQAAFPPTAVWFDPADQREWVL